ncbi:hypothetical protein NQ315_016089 [Exocentrus adspersus]|uniref:DUF5641 domain-containing protein n=1 Tax=Exocentrus adspersus TaxID=1586481 RepID=A0AAV8VLM0_9CUCU|nr:hypothetical protein NQ315_016089 [Exocentrus adspersus]
MSETFRKKMSSALSVPDKPNSYDPIPKTTTVDCEPNKVLQNTSEILRETTQSSTQNDPLIVASVPPRTPGQILKMCGISSHKQKMSSKKRMLYGHLKRVHKKLQNTRCAKNNFRKRLSDATRFIKDRSTEENLAALNTLAAHFIRCQFRETGINTNIFDNLKKRAAKLDESEKYVSVIFDEMSIMPAINFNEKLGKIIGFEDMGNGKRSVVYIRGIKKPFKQPVAYCFSSRGGAKAIEIKVLLKKILSLLLEYQLKPITVICDQAAANVNVIKTLDRITECREQYVRKGQGDTFREDHFEIDEFNIFPMYDPPHLLKGIRNNFLIKDIIFKKGTQEKVAKWRDIITIYERDNSPNTSDGLRIIPHITDEHVCYSQIKKMKVKFAAQVFSQRLASTMHFISKFALLNSTSDIAVIDKVSLIVYNGIQIGTFSSLKLVLKQRGVQNVEYFQHWLVAFADGSEKGYASAVYSRRIDAFGNVRSYWKRWQSEYLTNLQISQKWNTPSLPVKVGMVVVLIKENVPPLHWPLGIVKEIYPGKDGTVRVALIKTKCGTYKRPVVRLCPLPTHPLQIVNFIVIKCGRGTIMSHVELIHPFILNHNDLRKFKQAINLYSSSQILQLTDLYDYNTFLLPTTKI